MLAIHQPNRPNPDARAGSDVCACKRGLLNRIRFFSVQEEVYPENTVMVCQTVGGDEEIPDGVVACFTPNAPDVLSHVSVRARNCEVPPAPALKEIHSMSCVV